MNTLERQTTYDCFYIQIMLKFMKYPTKALLLFQDRIKLMFLLFLFFHFGSVHVINFIIIYIHFCL